MKWLKLIAVSMMLVPGIFADVAEKPVAGTLEGVQGFRKPKQEIKMAVPGFLWVEVEDFDSYGEWRLDTQFVHTMGSAYLLAGGICEPVADAQTTIRIEKAATYRIWARTKNWLKEFAPGQFALVVNGEQSAKVLGAAEHERWGWELVGDFKLAAGENRLALKDLSGAFARCDAILLTTDSGYTPPDDLEKCQQERARLTGVAQSVSDGGDFDVIVVGAGTAGCSAAISAARGGARTALIQDRPVLGGNASIELGVGTDGASVSKRNARETGIVEEANLIRVHNGQHKMSAAYQQLADDEPNLKVFYNSRVIGAEMKDKATLSAVISVNTLTLERKRFKARIFVDCTGDGWVGYYAGAQYRFGREASQEFGETAAPEKADEITMSGCLMGNLTCGYRAQDEGRPVAYTPPTWAVKLLPPDQFHRAPRGFTSGQWWLEHPGTFNDLEEPERARDELIRIIFAYWNWIKESSEYKDAAKNYKLTYVPHIDARRETRRLVGDYIMKQQDAEAGTLFDDRIAYGGWSLDVHHPLGIHSGKEGPYDFDGQVPLYSIPFRSLYSVNIDNLLFAGRHMSVTHIALGTVRVQATLAMVGQAAGTAAAMCISRSVTPRGIQQNHITLLQQQLLKDDCYIPELKNADPADLARRAAVTASSTARFDEFGKSSYKTDTKHPLNMNRATMIRRGVTPQIGKVQVLLTSSLDKPVKLKLHMRGARQNCDFSSRVNIAVAEATVAPGRRYVAFEFNAAPADDFIWFWFPKVDGIEWETKKSALIEGCRAYGNEEQSSWTVVESQQYALYVEPGIRIEENYAPANVIDGVARIVGREKHCWVSDPAQPLPQWIELDFGKPVKLSSLRVTFDTELNARFPASPIPKELVKDYRIAILKEGQWVEVAAVKDNIQRHCVHAFEAAETSQVRLTVEATHGATSARVFEIRAY